MQVVVRIALVLVALAVCAVHRAQSSKAPQAAAAANATVRTCERARPPGGAKQAKSDARAVCARSGVFGPDHTPAPRAHAKDEDDSRAVDEEFDEEYDFLGDELAEDYYDDGEDVHGYRRQMYDDDYDESDEVDEALGVERDVVDRDYPEFFARVADVGGGKLLHEGADILPLDHADLDDEYEYFYASYDEHDDGYDEETDDANSDEGINDTSDELEFDEAYENVTYASTFVYAS